MHIQEFHPKLLEKDKLYGTTTMGARGQVVIPAQARQDLKLKPGDQLLVMGKYGKALGLLKADELEDLISLIMSKISGTGFEKEFKRHLQKVFKDLPFKKESKK